MYEYSVVKYRILKHAYLYKMTLMYPYSIVLVIYLLIKVYILYALRRGAGRSIIGGANIHIFVFCTINFFWNRNLDIKVNCFYSLWTRIYEYWPPQLSIFRRPWLYVYSYYLMKLHEFFFILQAHAGIFFLVQFPAWIFFWSDTPPPRISNGLPLM